MARKTFPFLCSCGELVLTKAPQCPKCQRSYRERRKARLQPGQMNDCTRNTKNYKLNNPEMYLLRNPRARARQKGWDFDLTVEDIKIPTHCPVLHVKLDPVSSGTPFSPSVDRIDCKRGYTKDNVRVISWRANNLLGDGVLSEFKNIVEFLEKQSQENDDE